MGTAGDRVYLLGMGIDNIDAAGAIQRIDEYVREGSPHHVVTANLDFLRLGVHDASFLEMVNRAHMVVADGMPLVWSSRFLGDHLTERVAGVDLVKSCAALCVSQGYRLFLLGAAPGVAGRAASRLRTLYPSLHVAGTYSPPRVGDPDDAKTIEIVRRAKPDILLVAFGAPRQETWIQRHMESLQVPVSIGVGGTLDILAGRLNRAPSWMQGAGLEWFYRFLQEPGRLWKRYFVQDLPTLVQLMNSVSLFAPTSVSSLPFSAVPDRVDVSLTRR
ncbi:MAG TPA: WecB/TagA/CpsF family glycosyltransferase [Chloroflexota bacterium]|nr:WecB/TagA/CpsF family glycosyltransferase [Chloroflexota bacterium]